jgi:hypothetical protein
MWASVQTDFAAWEKSMVSDPIPQHLEASALRRIAEVATGVRAHFETVPADVCEYRHRD